MPAFEINDQHILSTGGSADPQFQAFAEFDGSQALSDIRKPTLVACTSFTRAGRPCRASWSCLDRLAGPLYEAVTGLSS